MSLLPRPVNFDECWSDLSVILDAVFTRGKVERKVWNDAFSVVYALCVAYPKPLRKELYHEIRKYLENRVKGIYEDIMSSGDEWRMNKYYSHWQRYSEACKCTNSLFTHLNQMFIDKYRRSESEYTYGDPTTQIMGIRELAYDVWKRVLIKPLQKSLINRAFRGNTSVKARL